MSVQIDVLFSGFSGKLEVGYLGWGTWALLRDGTHTMVLDTGFVGLRQNYNEVLGKYGVSPQDVDHVLLTHLHFDHACNVDRYPNAQFVVSRQEWEYANSAGRDLFIEDAGRSVCCGTRQAAPGGGRGGGCSAELPPCSPRATRRAAAAMWCGRTGERPGFWQETRRKTGGSC